MEIISKKHRRKLSYDDASALDELGVSAGRIDRSLCREWKEHWDGKAYQWGNSGLGYCAIGCQPGVKVSSHKRKARTGGIL